MPLSSVFIHRRSTIPHKKSPYGASAGGLAFWVNVFNTGGTTEDINSGFVGSVEYYGKKNGSGGNPAKWVREAYLDVLFRAA